MFSLCGSTTTVLCCAGFCRAAAGGANEPDPDRPRHHRLSAEEEAQVGAQAAAAAANLLPYSTVRTDRTREAEPLLHPCCSGSHLTLDGSGEPGGRRDTGASLDSVGASSGSLSPLEPPSPLFPPDGSGGEGSLTSEVFLNVLKLNQNRKRQETKYGTSKPAQITESKIIYCFFLKNSY